MITGKRFWEHVQRRGDGCWSWLSTKTNKGYGRIMDGGKPYLAHRVAYRLEYGYEPGELFVCHKCDNPTCVNPKHLFLGTNKDNMNDRDRKWQKSGRLHHLSKMTAEKVVNLRQDYEAGGYSHNSLAKKYGIAKKSVYKILHRVSWKYV